MIRLHKTGSAIFCIALLAGCTSPAADSTPSASAEAEDAESQAERIGTLIIQKNWDGLSRLFSKSSMQGHSAKDLETLWNNTVDGDASMISDVFQAEDDERTVSYTLLSAGDQMVYAVCDYQDDLSVSEMAFELQAEAPVIENSDAYTEEIIETGNRPSCNGVLTMPVGNEYPYLAILMPEGLEDAADASGQDASFRRDLAHALAENGIASIRYDMRLHEDPAVSMSNADLNLDRIYFRDLASCIHSVEKYPVDASNIIYIGHGISGTLGYSVCYHHFELTGGLVLLGAPFETGTEMLAQYYGISADDRRQAEDALKDSDRDVDEIGGYPFSYWREWDSASPLSYTPHVAIPIAVFQGENDAVTSFSEDYENWKSQKGSNVSMVSYEGVGHSMRDEDGTFTTLASDIASWLNGEDIEKIAEERHKQQEQQEGRAS